ncbi:MAG: hypothetical protein ACOCUV_00895 [bacterium]
MAYVQKRIRALDIYSQGLPADGDYIDPSNIYLAVDNSTESWAEPKKIPFSDLLLTSGHIEAGRLSGLSSRSVSVTFDEPFTSQPYGDEPKVYRMEQQPDGTWRRKQVLWGFNNSSQPSTTGFELTISDSENLTGIIIEYLYL